MGLIYLYLYLYVLKYMSLLLHHDILHFFILCKYTGTFWYARLIISCSHLLCLLFTQWSWGSSRDTGPSAGDGYRENHVEFRKINLCITSHCITLRISGYEHISRNRVPRRDVAATLLSGWRRVPGRCSWPEPYTGEARGHFALRTGKWKAVASHPTSIRPLLLQGTTAKN